MKEPSTLTSLILPREVFEHFEIVATQADEQQVHLYLDQKNDPPARHDYTYTSKGFTEQTIVQDFPLRGVPVLLQFCGVSRNCRSLPGVDGSNPNLQRTDNR